jgi:eukaryotic-like serine/threonine-protein kinase
MSTLIDPTGRAQRTLAGRYRLLVALGAGESAEVYLAQDLALGRRVAIKLLRPELNDNQAFLRSLRAEARAVAVLSHPNIMGLFDWVEDVDGPFLVLEYLARGSLRDMLDRGIRLTPGEAARIGGQVARGLAYAHSRGLIHRDIKPANLLFDEEGRVRITDFGIARALAEVAWTEPGAPFIGTPRYSAPEQVRGGPLDGRSDVYSLALVLYESVTGVVPFTSDTVEKTLMARVGEPLPPHPALGPLHELLGRAADPDLNARLDAARLATLLEEAAQLWPTAAIPGARPDEAWIATTIGNGVGFALHPEPTVTAPALPASPAAPPLPAAPLPPPPPRGERPHTAAYPKPTPGRPRGAGTPRRPEAGPNTPARHRRRWPWVTAIVVVALAGAGLSVAWQQKVFTPSHPVPSLEGLSPVAARGELGKVHLLLAVGGRASSTTVPLGDVISEQPSTSTPVKEGDVVTVVLSDGLPIETVPSLVGLNCDGATRVLAAQHLGASCPAGAAAYNDGIPAGVVLNWSYQNRLNITQAPYGATIIIAISLGKHIVTIPSLPSDTYAQARSTLRNDGLQVTEVQESSATVPSGSVTRTVPPAGSGVVVGGSVIVFVSRGPAIVKVPDVRHDTVAAAKTALESAGFIIGSVKGSDDGDVVSTDPSAGQFAAQGTTIDLTTDGRRSGHDESDDDPLSLFRDLVN